MEYKDGLTMRAIGGGYEVLDSATQEFKGLVSYDEDAKLFIAESADGEFALRAPRQAVAAVALRAHLSQGYAVPSTPRRMRPGRGRLKDVVGAVNEMGGLANKDEVYQFLADAGKIETDDPAHGLRLCGAALGNAVGRGWIKRFKASRADVHKGLAFYAPLAADDDEMQAQANDRAAAWHKPGSDRRRGVSRKTLAVKVENRRLRARIVELEAELAAARAEAQGAPADDAPNPENAYAEALMDFWGIN